MLLSFGILQVLSFGGRLPSQCGPKDKLVEAIAAGGTFDLTPVKGVVLMSGQDSTKLTIQKGALQPTDVLSPVWSASKLVTSILINKLVESSVAGLELDAPISKYIDWWTKDAEDPRSKVTMRHLLSQTSGFGSDVFGEHGPATCEVEYQMPCLDDAMGALAAAGSSCDALKNFGCEFDLSTVNKAAPAGTTVAQMCPVSCGSCSGRKNQETCSKYLYENQFGNLAKGMMGTYPGLAADDVTAGSHFAYGESHFVLAVYAVEQTTGEKWIDLFKQHLTEPLQLDDSCAFPDVPTIDGGAMLRCSATDLSKILAAYYSGKIVASDTMADMEASQIEALGAKIPQENYKETVTDHYGLGMWRICPKQGCSGKDLVHSIGVDGVMPIIDREGGYWALIFREGGVFSGNLPGLTASMRASEFVVDQLRQVYKTCQL